MSRPWYSAPGFGLDRLLQHFWPKSKQALPRAQDAVRTPLPAAGNGRPAASSRHGQPTIWGMGPADIHDRFWASYGIQVVRQGDTREVSRSARYFLLLPPQVLVLFKLSQLVSVLSWFVQKVLFIRLHHTPDGSYQERVITDENEQFLRFQRTYGSACVRTMRLGLTSDRKIAHLWQTATSTRAGWRLLSTVSSSHFRASASAAGRFHNLQHDEEVMRFVRDLLVVWGRPDASVKRVRMVSAEVWADERAVVGRGARIIGPVWIGAGRRVASEASVVGPAVLWDDPEERPPAEELSWQELAPLPLSVEHSRWARQRRRIGHRGKRTFDLLLCFLGLLVTLPFYPLVMLAILLEDGRPFFFVHWRETVGGRRFPCLKFRSMRRDADRIKGELAGQNDADGPQFYIPDDPRLTRVGRLLRKIKLDEVPQLLNVLLGHMSLVGPRPSPYDENQFCPPWREARLSVRPGITGLWQVMRTRQRGLDFQEWIKYDLEYVRTMSWRVDLWILWKTLRAIFDGH